MAVFLPNVTSEAEFCELFFVELQFIKMVPRKNLFSYTIVLSFAQ